MKTFKFKLLLLAPALVLSACGYGLKEVYSGIPYASSDFFANYYNVWNKAINPYENDNKLTLVKDAHVLTESDHVFKSIHDTSFKSLDPHWNEYSYTFDKEEPEDGTKAYGPTVALTNYDNSFKYGVTSKMFDGQMFCNGDYANARTQVESTNNGEDKGFGVLFSKESNDASYFMMNFKCSVILKDNQNLKSGYSNLKVTVSFICKNDTGYTYIPVVGEVNEVPTNSGDQHYMKPYSEREHMYVCYGFDVSQLGLNRLIGFTIQYEKISDTVSPNYEEKSFHAMMLYEVSFPYTTWH